MAARFNNIYNALLQWLSEMFWMSVELAELAFDTFTLIYTHVTLIHENIITLDEQTHRDFGTTEIKVL